MNALTTSRIIYCSIIALAFPVCSILVFSFDYNRESTANGLALIYSIGLMLAIFSPLLPFKQFQQTGMFGRAQSISLFFLGLSYFTHLTWELGWLVAHQEIIANPDSPWTYTWWAYMDGGDFRYAKATPTLIAMEALSVTNGVIGAIAMWFYYRKPELKTLALLLFGLTACVHIYSASLYFLSEILDGFSNVNTESIISLYFKFGLANLPWVITPFFVFYWVFQSFMRDYAFVKSKQIRSESR